MNYKQRYAYGNGFVLLAEGLNMFRLAAFVTGGNMKSTDNVSFTKRTSVVWMPGSWTQRDRIAFAEGLCERGGGIILAEGLNMFRPAAIVTGGNMKSTDNVSFTERTSVVWMPGSWTQRDGIAFAEGLCERGGGIILAEGLHYCGRRAVFLFQLYPDICLKKPKLV
jgi:hypothetical protein